MSRQLQEAGHDQRAGSFFVYNYPTWLHVDSRLEIANCKLGLSNWKLQISNWTLQIGNYKCRRRRRVPTRSPLPHAWKALPRKPQPRSQQRVRRGSEPTPLPLDLLGRSSVSLERQSGPLASPRECFFAFLSPVPYCYNDHSLSAEAKNPTSNARNAASARDARATASACSQKPPRCRRRAQDLEKGARRSSSAVPFVRLGPIGAVISNIKQLERQRILLDSGLSSIHMGQLDSWRSTAHALDTAGRRDHTVAIGRACVRKEHRNNEQIARLKRLRPTPRQAQQC